jgi:alkanesulfonate monooxygenase SsuD/methylene tetrahydromethanopterin reductase-like flavin-dependent oxidoreductase (luciferase family)
MMHLGLFLAGDGHHIAAWRVPGARKGANLDIRHYVELARIAERGKFDFLFTADTNAVFYGDDIEQTISSNGGGPATPCVSNP